MESTKPNQAEYWDIVNWLLGFLAVSRRSVFLCLLPQVTGKLQFGLANWFASEFWIDWEVEGNAKTTLCNLGDIARYIADVS